MSRMRAANRARARLREADVTDMTRLDQFCDRADRVFDRYCGVDTGQAVHVYIFRLKPA